MEPAVLSYENISVGDTASFEIVLTDSHIDDFARLSGNTTPLHTDDNFAAQTPFGRRIAHGLLGASFFSTLFGMYIPGVHGLCLSHTLLYRAPIYAGMRLLVSGEVVQKVDAARALKMHTAITDVDTHTILIDGDAVVKVM